MSARTIRLNELMRRELNDILRKDYQAEAVTLTITEVRVAPDLRDARVFVSIMGSAEDAETRMRWLRGRATVIRQEMARRVTMKYLPRFNYVLDDSSDRGVRLLQLLDDLDKPRNRSGEAGKTP